MGLFYTFTSVMYQEQSFEEQFDGLSELIRRFEALRRGNTHEFIDEDSFALIIDYYDDNEEMNRAMEAAEIGIQRFPYCADLLVKKAALLNAAGRFGTALAVLENAGALNPADINLYIHKIDALLGLNRLEEASRVMNDNIDRFNGEERSDLLLELNEVFDDWEVFDPAFDCLLLLLQEDPENEEGLQRIGFWTEYTGRMEEGIRLHKHIIDEHPFNAQAWFNLGWAFQEIKLYEKAIDAYEYVLAIDENFEYAYRNMADAFIRLRKYDKAIEILRTYLKNGSADSTIYEAMGYCYEKSKRFRKARSSYRKAIELMPEEDNLYFRIGHTYMLEEKWERAVSFIMAANKMHAGRAEYHLALGKCMIQLGLEQEAIDHFVEAIRIRPTSRRSRLTLIKALYQAALYAEALNQLDKAEAETRHLADYDYFRCAILLALDKPKEALLRLEIALTEAPGKLKILSGLDPAVMQRKEVVDVLVRFRRYL